MSWSAFGVTEEDRAELAAAVPKRFPTDLKTAAVMVFSEVQVRYIRRFWDGQAALVSLSTDPTQTTTVWLKNHPSLKQEELFQEGRLWHVTLVNWAPQTKPEQYGPCYTIKLGKQSTIKLVDEELQTQVISKVDKAPFALRNVKLSNPRAIPQNVSAETPPFWLTHTRCTKPDGGAYIPGAWETCFKHKNHEPCFTNTDTSCATYAFLIDAEFMTVTDGNSVPVVETICVLGEPGNVLLGGVSASTFCAWRKTLCRVSKNSDVASLFHLENLPALRFNIEGIFSGHKYPSATKNAPAVMVTYPLVTKISLCQAPQAPRPATKRPRADA